LTDVSHFKSCVEKEEETAKVTFEKLKKEFRLYERCFDLCMEEINCILDSTENKLFDSKAKEAISFILPRIVQSMQSIRLLQTKGYYCDSAILERSFYESVGLCAYLSFDEEEAIRWLHEKPIKVASIHLFDYVTRLLRVGEHDAGMKRVYGRLCDYVHTNVRSTITLITWSRNDVKIVSGIDSGIVTLQFIPQFDEKNVGKIALLPLLVILVLEEIFKKELKLDRKRQKKLKRLLELALLH
jgi:hypothetical protein